MDEEPEDKQQVVWISDHQGHTLIMLRPDMMDLGLAVEIIDLCREQGLAVEDDDGNPVIL